MTSQQPWQGWSPVDGYPSGSSGAPGARSTGGVRDVRWVVAVLALGALAGAVWRVAFGLRTSEEWGVEGFVAVAGLLAGVLALLGLMVGVAYLVRPGDRPARRMLLLAAATTGAGLVAWGVGRALGMPVLDAPVVVLVGPWTFAAVAGLGALVHTFRAP